MIKLFSMFVRYAQLPEKEFLRLSATQIFSLAETAEQQSKKVEVAAYEDSLSVRVKGHEITVEVFPSSRQLLYSSTLSPPSKFNYLGSKWVEGEQDLNDTFQKDLK
jgi:frataxin-like iron-binding protein CyaY